MRTSKSSRLSASEQAWRPPRLSVAATPTTDGPPGHAFSDVSVHAPARKISGSGTGKVNIDYAPEPGDTSTKIVFIQVMRESLDGKVHKPGQILPSFAYQDADTTSEGFHVDYDSGEKDPYYNGDDAGHDGGAQGSGPAKTKAHMDDTPGMDDAHFPAGTSHLHYDFRTTAFSAAGPDAGKYFGWVDWTFDKVKGKPSTTKVGTTGTYGPGAYWQNAIKLWSTNHGFALPALKP